MSCILVTSESPLIFDENGKPVINPNIDKITVTRELNPFLQYELDHIDETLKLFDEIENYKK